MVKTQEQCVSGKEIKEYLNSLSSTEIMQEYRECIGHIRTLTESMSNILASYKVLAVMFGIHVDVTVSETVNGEVFKAELGLPKGVDVRTMMESETEEEAGWRKGEVKG